MKETHKSEGHAILGFLPVTRLSVKQARGWAHPRALRPGTSPVTSLSASAFTTPSSTRLLAGLQVQLWLRPEGCRTPFSLAPLVSHTPGLPTSTHLSNITSQENRGASKPEWVAYLLKSPGVICG